MNKYFILTPLGPEPFESWLKLQRRQMSNVAYWCARRIGITKNSMSGVFYLYFNENLKFNIPSIFPANDIRQPLRAIDIIPTELLGQFNILIVKEV